MGEADGEDTTSSDEQTVRAWWVRALNPRQHRQHRQKAKVTSAWLCILPL